MRSKKVMDQQLLKIGDEVFWKTFKDRDMSLEQRYVIVQDGRVVVMNGKMMSKPRKIRV